MSILGQVRCSSHCAPPIFKLVFFLKPLGSQELQRSKAELCKASRTTTCSLLEFQAAITTSTKETLSKPKQEFPNFTETKVYPSIKKRKVTKMFEKPLLGFLVEGSKFLQQNRVEKFKKKKTLKNHNFFFENQRDMNVLGQKEALPWLRDQTI